MPPGQEKESEMKVAFGVRSISKSAPAPGGESLVIGGLGSLWCFGAVRILAGSSGYVSNLDFSRRSEARVAARELKRRIKAELESVTE